MEKITNFFLAQKQPQSLIEILNQNFKDFFAMDYASFIKTIQACIPESLLFKGKANTTAEGLANSVNNNNFYGLTEVEEIRAFSGLLRFKDVIGGRKEDYDQFVACQIEFKKPVLTFDSFVKMQTYVKTVLKSPEDYAAAMWSILCNDLGKVHSVIEAYEQLPDKNPTSHDLLLAELLVAKPDLFPGFQALPLKQRELTIAGYASGCDISQFEQLELPVIALTGLKSLSKAELDLYILHTIFDVAGAAAHVKSNGSLTMHEETWNFFGATCQCLEKLPTQSIEAVYTDYVAFRGHCIGIKNVSPEATALIRIAGMARLATDEQGQMLLEVWQSLPHDIKEILVKELNIHGREGAPGIFVGYGVAMLLNPQAAMQKQLQEKAKQQGLEVTAAEKRRATVQGLSIGLINLAQLFKKLRLEIDTTSSSRIVAAECHAIAEYLAINPSIDLQFEINVNQSNAFLLTLQSANYSFITKLPNEILIRIAKFVSPIDTRLLAASAIKWRDLIEDDAHWHERICTELTENPKLLPGQPYKDYYKSIYSGLYRQEKYNFETKLSYFQNYKAFGYSTFRLPSENDTLTEVSFDSNKEASYQHYLSLISKPTSSHTPPYNLINFDKEQINKFLKEACYQGAEKWLADLVYQGADVKGVFENEFKSGSPSAPSFIAKSQTNALLIAAQNGNPTCVEYLLFHGVNPNDLLHWEVWDSGSKYGGCVHTVEKYSVLHKTLIRLALVDTQCMQHYLQRKNGYFTCLQVLLQHGANPNITNMRGNTCLLDFVNYYLMSANKNIDYENFIKSCIELLIQFGADVNKVNDEGNTILHIAINYQKLNYVHFFIEKGRANILALDRQGNTPLILAVRSGNIAVVKYLLEHGSKSNEVNSNGETALSIAEKHQLKEIIELLEASTKINNMPRP